MKHVSLQNINISSSSVLDDNDFFSQMYSSSALKQTTMIIFFSGAILGLILEFGIIWYEKHGNHRYRTVINQLFSTISWSVVTYILVVYIPYGIRYLAGPLHPMYCSIQTFMANVLCDCIVLTLDCITLLRYLFIFKFSNFTVVNDDIVATFLQAAIVLLSLWMATVKMMSAGRMPLNYFMCLGKDPNEDHSVEPFKAIIGKFDTTCILVVVSFILNIVAFLKIFLYQRQTEQRTQQIELGRNGNFGNDGQQRKLGWGNEEQQTVSRMPKSMADLTTQILCLMFAVSQVFVITAMNQLKPLELNNYENRWMAYYVQIIGNSIAILGISVQYYIKHHSLPKAIWRNIKDTINI
jgi:hypothetical protein